MCSENCPCPEEVSQIYGNLSNSEKAYFQRSELTLGESGRTFSTFKQCWNDRLATSSLYDSAFVEIVNGYLDTMDIYEAEASCSGICQPGLFWFTQPVTLERPTQPCILDIFEDGSNEIESNEDFITKLQWGGSSGGDQWGSAASAFSQGGGSASS